MNELRTRAATILRDHFDTEASDAGLKSLNLESTGASGSRSFDGAAIARAARSLSGNGSNHVRTRKALAQLSTPHRDVLTLAYGIRLRTRDIEDGKKRKALRQNERNWRVRLAEIYGSQGAYVLASPLAKRLLQKHIDHLNDGLATEVNTASTDSGALPPELQHRLDTLGAAVEGGLIPWLLDAGRAHSAAIQADANKLLNAALDAFAAQYGLSATPPEPRKRSSEPSKTRILASHSDHGYEIG